MTPEAEIQQIDIAYTKQADGSFAWQWNVWKQNPNDCAGVGHAPTLSACLNDLRDYLEGGHDT